MTNERGENALALFDVAPMPRPVGDADPVVLPSHARTIVPIIRAYDSFIVRLYCLLRFRILRRPIELHAGLAFGVLAVSNLFAAWVEMPVASGELPLERTTWFLLLTRGMAAACPVGPGSRAASAAHRS